MHLATKHKYELSKAWAKFAITLAKDVCPLLADSWWAGLMFDSTLVALALLWMAVADFAVIALLAVIAMLLPWMAVIDLAVVALVRMAVIALLALVALVLLWMVAADGAVVALLAVIVLVLLWMTVADLAAADLALVELAAAVLAVIVLLAVIAMALLWIVADLAVMALFATLSRTLRVWVWMIVADLTVVALLAVTAMEILVTVVQRLEISTHHPDLLAAVLTVGEYSLRAVQRAGMIEQDQAPPAHPL